MGTPQAWVVAHELLRPPLGRGAVLTVPVAGASRGPGAGPAREGPPSPGSRGQGLPAPTLSRASLGCAQSPGGESRLPMDAEPWVRPQGGLGRSWASPRSPRPQQLTVPATQRNWKPPDGLQASRTSLWGHHSTGKKGKLFDTRDNSGTPPGIAWSGRCQAPKAAFSKKHRVG